MEQEKNSKTGGRKRGSVNLPKFTLVPLAALTAQLKVDAMVPVDRDYAKGIMLAYNATQDVHNQIEAEDEQPIPAIRKDFSKNSE
jgi:hypothetical protein